MARSGGRATFCWLAARAIALMKQADQPAANSCSGLVPLPALPGDDSLTSRRPSLVREAPSRPPVVCVLAVYSTFSIGVVAFSFSSFAALPLACLVGVVRDNIISRANPGNVTQAIAMACLTAMLADQGSS